ncbi:Crp/Fnr family transcriptional regulator [Flavihumibacter rivuli]|uniref:Crp/Fnr family transcriptional regulator n=1 Tax=Flavihumibacter rivuli TaxID=2838156 RepID=UPI001BDEBD2E|nr:Crp/Fnr family transcriptional regulator [Flavihumibacter rivuli]ULQ55482.1 Crp/Fnr family transcriptional regulator [Flavihumibacter rivuli]
MKMPDPSLIYKAYKEHIRSYASFRDETWELIENILTVKACKKGEYIVEEGKICRHIDFIYKGSFRAFSNKDGEDITTGIYLEGICLTNMKSLTTVTPSHTYLQALEDSITARLYKDSLIGIYEKSTELQAVGRAILEGMIVEENEWKEMYTLYDPEERYKFLLQKSPEIIQRVSLQYVASFLGIRRETLSRIRNRSSR